MARPVGTRLRCRPGLFCAALPAPAVTRGPALGLLMVNGLHLYSAFIQSAVQFKPLIHPFTHTFTHQRRLAAMQGTNQLVRSNWGLGVLLGDTSTGWDRTREIHVIGLCWMQAVL